MRQQYLILNNCYNLPTCRKKMGWRKFNFKELLDLLPEQKKQKIIAIPANAKIKIAQYRAPNWAASINWSACSPVANQLGCIGEQHRKITCRLTKFASVTDWHECQHASIPITTRSCHLNQTVCQNPISQTDFCQRLKGGMPLINNQIEQPPVNYCHFSGATCARPCGNSKVVMCPCKCVNNKIVSIKSYFYRNKKINISPITNQQEDGEAFKQYLKLGIINGIEKTVDKILSSEDRQAINDFADKIAPHLDSKKFADLLKAAHFNPNLLSSSKMEAIIGKILDCFKGEIDALAKKLNTTPKKIKEAAKKGAAGKAKEAAKKGNGIGLACLMALFGMLSEGNKNIAEGQNGQAQSKEIGNDKQQKAMACAMLIKAIMEMAKSMAAQSSEKKQKGGCDSCSKQSGCKSCG